MAYLTPIQRRQSEQSATQTTGYVSPYQRRKREEEEARREAQRGKPNLAMLNRVDAEPEKKTTTIPVENLPKPTSTSSTKTEELPKQNLAMLNRVEPKSEFEQKSKAGQIIDALGKLPGALMDKERSDQIRSNINNALLGESEYSSPEMQKYWEEHPTLNKLFGPESFIGRVTDKVSTAHDVLGSGMRAAAFGDTQNTLTGGVAPTTGNETADAILRTLGGISSIALPSGGGAPSMVEPVRNAAELVANKLIPNVGNAVGRIGNVALRGALESLPYTAQQIFVGDKKSIKDMAKIAGKDLLFGVVTELGIEGAGELFKAIGNKLKNGDQLTAGEKSLVDEIASPAKEATDNAQPKIEPDNIKPSAPPETDVRRSYEPQKAPKQLSQEEVFDREIRRQQNLINDLEYQRDYLEAGNFAEIDEAKKTLEKLQADKEDFLRKREQTMRDFERAYQYEQGTLPLGEIEVEVRPDPTTEVPMSRANTTEAIQAIEPVKINDNIQTPSSEIKPIENSQKPLGMTMAERSSTNLGDRKVKAYMFENPEVKDYYQTIARYILDDEFVPNAQLNRTTAIMEKLKADTGLQPAQVKDALERLVKNHGQENVAAAKRVELVIDDMLTNGFETVRGEKVPPLQDYINIKSQIEGMEIKPRVVAGLDDIPAESNFAKPVESNIPKAETTSRPTTLEEMQRAMYPDIDWDSKIKALDDTPEPKKVTAVESADTKVKIEEPKRTVIDDYKPKTDNIEAPENKVFIEEYTKTLPDAEAELDKLIETLEDARWKEKDESNFTKINLQLFAAKEKKRRIFGDTPRGPLPEGEVERGFSRNIRTDADMPDEIREAFDDKPLGYKQLSNEKTLAKAENIMAQGQASAVSEFYRLLNDKTYHAETVPLAKLIAKNAQTAGDTALARQVLSDVAVKLTEAGQFSQAAKILREGDPETFLITLQKQINKLNLEGQKVYKKKWNIIELTDDEISGIGKINQGDDAAFEAMMEEVHDRIAKEIPSNAWEKFDSWRRMAMLLNPTTHVRNLVGNTIMGGMQKTSDSVAAILERVFVKPEERTKSFLWRTDKNRVKLVQDSWEANKKQIMKNGRWDLESGVGSLKELNSYKPVFKKGIPTKVVENIRGKQFKTGALEKVNELSKNLLNVEDNLFVKVVYEDALGQYLKARKLNTVTDEAIEYATRRAYEATFKQANMLSTMITKIKSVPVVGRFAEAAIPFSKTPSNIAMRAFEYGPGGIMKALYSGVAKKGASQVIEDLAKGVTGTGIAALGFGLAAAGWARGKNSMSEKLEALKTKMGEQAFSITTPLGSYTIDWAQPFAIPLITGITMYEELQNPKYDGKMVEAILNSIYKGGDTLFEMTMLKNIKQLFGYGSTTEKIGMLALSYITQAVPSVLGKIARAIDPTVRETYDPNPAKEEWNRILAKIPGLSTVLPEKVDNFGEAVKQNGALEQFLSPGYAKGKDNRTFMKEIERLYNLEKDTDLIPSMASGKFTHKGEDIIMTARELERFKKRYGELILNGTKETSGLQQLFNSTLYKNATDKKRADLIKKRYSKAYEKAKEELLSMRGIK